MKMEKITLHFRLPVHIVSSRGPVFVFHNPNPHAFYPTRRQLPVCAWPVVSKAMVLLKKFWDVRSSFCCASRCVHCCNFNKHAPQWVVTLAKPECSSSVMCLRGIISHSLFVNRAKCTKIGKIPGEHTRFRHDLSAHILSHEIPKKDARHGKSYYKMWVTRKAVDFVRRIG